jgi:hypothetical protein
MNIYGLDITIFISKFSFKFFYSELNLIIDEPNPIQLTFKYLLIFFININIQINLYIF